MLLEHQTRGRPTCGLLRRAIVSPIVTKEFIV